MKTGRQFPVGGGCTPMIVLALGIIVLLVLAGSAFAQIPCAMRDEMLKILAGKYRESLIAKFGANGDSVEMYSSPGGTTVTIIATRKDGLTCIIAEGRDLKTFPMPTPGNDI